MWQGFKKGNKMNKTEIEKKLDELGKEIPELIKEVETYKATIEEYKAAMEKLKAEVKKPTFERVEKGEKYYFVDVYRGKFFAKYEVDEHSILDDEIYASNNYFLTRERTKEVADKINFLLKLERLHDTFCPDYKPDWEDGRPKWAVFFTDDDKEYITIWTTRPKECAAVYFDSKETADKVCKELNKEMKKKQ